MGNMVNAKWDDLVRVEYPHKAVTMPAELIFSVDQSLKLCGLNGGALIVYKTGADRWIAECGGQFVGCGCSPIQAIANMAEEG